MISLKLPRPVLAALATGATVALGASPAAAEVDPFHFTQHHPVPAGQVQHMVTEHIQAQDGKQTRHSRVEAWTATAASRTIVSNVDTGRVTYECGSTAVEWSCYFPDDNVLEHGSGNDPLVNASWRDQGDFWKQGMGDRSEYQLVGKAVDIGRPVTVYKYTSKVAYLNDKVPITETFDLDDEFGLVLKNVISAQLTDDTALEDSTVVTTMETLTEAPVALGLIARPGAKSKRITGSRLPATATPPTGKAKPKAKAKTKAKSKSKAKKNTKAKAKKKATKKHRKATKKSARR